MNLNETKRVANTCSACGTALPANLPPALCPKCLLKAGLPSQAATLENATPARPSRTMPQPNEQFGHYRIIRQIGQGGMGAVFEAEDLENGRRLALKIMSHTLDSRETRARFLREGRLAASINHPNSVYIFGTEEIAGMPVIAMEFITGGTLQDRVKQKGPLPATEAVDSILQVIDGLEAAQRLGVLHRDVKPSNCFMDPDGKVKIGDFGLSINTAIRLEPTLTATGAFMGTPAYASPEQLRGDELSVRSDIYAVGITFYYLLTGTVPFDAPNLPQLLAAILERPVESPTKRRNTVPDGLSQVIIRCLEKNPDKRLQNYNELRQALLSYASTAPVPANLIKRFAAYCVDLSLMSLLSPLFLYMIARCLNLQLYSGVTADKTESMIIGFITGIISFSASLLYFTLLEGFWGTTCGKALFGLRVMRADRDRPGILRALGRFMVVTGPISLGTMALSLVSPALWQIMVLSLWAPGWWSHLWTLLLLVTIRKHNGFAALHDLFTGTRVVQRSVHPIRSPLSVVETVPNIAADLPQIGPYQVLEKSGSAADCEWLVGYDARLLRRVWIRKLKPDDPPVSPTLRNLGRQGRLRWLNGKRSPAEAWDAYEAVLGQPLAKLVRQRQSWDRVRFWLLDLAEELQAAQADRSLPARLLLDHVWITADNHAKLLDFSSPGASENQESMATLPEDFLRQVAISALEGRPISLDESRNKPIAVPLALHVRAFLDYLPKTTVLKETLESLKSLLSKPAIVTRMRRLVLTLGYISWPVFTIITVAAAMLVFMASGLQSSGLIHTAFLIGIFAGLFTLYLVSFFALGAALLFRGGLLMHLADVTVVNRDGTPASRWRVFWRNLIAVLPLTLLLLLGTIGYYNIRTATWGIWLLNYITINITHGGWMDVEEMLVAAGLIGLIGLQVILTIISLVLPNRSLQDRLAGTWLVPK